MAKSGPNKTKYWRKLSSEHSKVGLKGVQHNPRNSPAPSKLLALLFIRAGLGFQLTK